jgi:hypothetical protein
MSNVQRNLVPDFIDLDALLPVQSDERIIEAENELISHVGPFFNAANLTEDSTQPEREAVFWTALELAIGDSRWITPRSHPALDWCLATKYNPLVSCHAVLAGSADDLSVPCPTCGLTRFKCRCDDQSTCG